MVCEPPVSLPYTVIVVCIVDVRLGFGINLNVLPVTTAAVVVTSSPKNIGAVNTEKDELGFYLLDRNLGFVASNGNSNNTLNISKIEMTSVVQFMKGKVFDSSSKKIISDATINLYDEYGTLLNSQNTSSRGFYYFNVIPLDNYTIEVIKKDYTTLKSKFSAHKTNNNTYLVNLEIEKQVIDQENKLPKTNISPENGDSDFFKKQLPNSSIKEDKNLNKKYVIIVFACHIEKSNCIFS